LSAFHANAIHASNYLKDRVKEDLLPWLVVPEDAFQNNYPKEQLRFVTDLYKETLLRELTAEKWVEYIVNRLQECFPNRRNYLISRQELETEAAFNARMEE